MREKKNIAELTRYSVEEYRQVAKLPVRIVLDNVRSMQNVGSVFRTADAFRFEALELCGITGCPPSAEISKTALGAEKSVEWRYEESTLEACRRLKEEGWRLLALEQTHNSIPLHEMKVAPGEKVALILGNEVEGVSQDVIDICDASIEIPMEGVKHSLNVAVSAGIAMYEIYVKCSKSK